MALSLIAGEGAGILIYEQQEGRGIGLMPKLQAYELQDAGLDTVEANVKLGFKADHREFQLPAEILKALGLKSVRLLSNNPQKVAALESAGIKVVERVPCEVEAHQASERYLPAVPALENGKRYLAYLDVWERHLSSVEADGAIEIHSASLLALT